MDEQTLPPGAIAKDVADDVDIKASEGEFIIPANIVRYLGVAKLEQMVKKATEELSSLDKTNRIGGNLQEAPTEQEQTPAFAEGGLVTAPSPSPEPLIEWEYQTTPSGFKIRVPKIKNKYVSVNFKSSDEGTPRQPLTGLAKNLNEWGIKDYTKFANSVATPGGRVGNKVAGALVKAATGPLSLIADKFAEDKRAQATKALKQMAETGKSPTGVSLTKEELEEVRQANSLIESPMKETMGEKITGAVTGSVLRGNLVGTAARVADVATGSKVSGALQRAKDSLRDGIHKTYSERKTQDKKGIISRPDKPSETTSSDRDMPRHANGVANVTGNLDQDTEIEDSITR